MTSLMFMSMITSIMFSLTKHPLSTGLWLIVQTIIMAMITGLMINMFWFSYILIMTMLSGALILFIYMTSVASNEKFSSNSTTMTVIITSMCTCTLIPLLLDQLEYSKVWSSSSGIPMINNTMMSLIKMFNLHNMFITMMLVLYLLLTMIVVSYITNTYEGPLRSKS